MVKTGKPIKPLRASDPHPYKPSRLVLGNDRWYQPTGGNVYQVKDVKANGSHLTLVLSQPEDNRPGLTWELDAAGDKLTGVQKRGQRTTPLAGVRAPALNRPTPAAWTAPEPLFNGKNLDGWEPIGNPANSHWVVQDGLLVNEAKGDNLKSTRKFDDFKVHYEVNCPEGEWCLPPSWDSMCSVFSN